jgi:hypothetical protein
VTTSRLAVLALILVSAGCAGKPVPQTALPSDPVQAIDRFLAAVKANDLRTMGDLWGSDKGPANAWMPQEERERRLMVIQLTLAYESYAVDPLGALPGSSSDERILRVQLYRNNCRPTVPFTVLRYHDGWLVSSIDLEAAGSPRRPCPPG